MAITIEFEGVDQLMAQIDLTVDRVNREVHKIVKDSAAPIKSHLQHNIPVGSPMKHADEGHARDDVRISKVKTVDTRKSVDIGFKKTEWRMWFLEFGTYGGRRIKARHYVEKSLIENSKKVISIQSKRLKEVIEKRGF